MISKTRPYYHHISCLFIILRLYIVYDTFFPQISLAYFHSSQNIFYTLCTKRPPLFCFERRKTGRIPLPVSI